MGTFSVWHLLVLLIVVILIFGTGKLRNAGKDLGSAVRGFKEGMKGEDDQQPKQLPTKEVNTPPAIDAPNRDRR